MKKLIICFFILIAIISVVISCSENLKTDDLNKTGLLDKSGNLITNTLAKTNILHFTGNIPIWATNGNFDYIIITNKEDKDNIEIKYTNEVIWPDYPEDASDFYKIFVPYSGIDYYTVSYKDTNRLKKLWLDQIFRKRQNDGKVFAIRNRFNDGGIFNNEFQKQRGPQARYDYYYFKDNGDIVYKGGDKTYYTKEILVKRFVGAVIVDYRKIKERSKPEEGSFIADKVENTGEWTVGAIYKMAIDVNEARDMFCEPNWNTVKGPGDKEGAYNFIGIGKIVASNRTSVALLTRQFYNTNFMEVLVLNPYSDGRGSSETLGIDSYHAYYGDYHSEPGELNVKGFTHENYPYMTDENLYLAHRPEDIVPMLNFSISFTSIIYNWKFLAIPGHRY